MAAAFFGQQDGPVASGQSSGSTYFANEGQMPDYLSQLVQTLMGQGQAAAGQYNDFISNPTASSLYQNQLQGLLAALAPSEAASRTAVNDAGVAAGNRSSGAFGGSVATNEGNIMRNRSTLASQLLGQMFPQMTQALQQPQTLAAQLASILKLQQQFGAQPQQQQQVSSQSGQAGMSNPAGTGLSWADTQARLQGYNSAAEYQAAQARDQLTNTLTQQTQQQTPQAAAAPAAQPGTSTYFSPNGDYVSGGTPTQAPWSPQESIQNINGTYQNVPNQPDYSAWTYSPAGDQFSFGGNNGEY